MNFLADDEPASGSSDTTSITSNAFGDVIKPSVTQPTQTQGQVSSAISGENGWLKAADPSPVSAERPKFTPPPVTSPNNSGQGQEPKRRGLLWLIILLIGLGLVVGGFVLRSRINSLRQANSQQEAQQQALQNSQTI